MTRENEICEVLEDEAWDVPARLSGAEFAGTMGADWRWTRVAGADAEGEI